MEGSLAKTLARKLNVSVRQVYRRFRTTMLTERGPRVVLQTTIPRDTGPPRTATWGGTDLVRRIRATLNDQPTPVHNDTRAEIVERLVAQIYELCGSQEQVEIHHVRALKDLQRRDRAALPTWAQVMIARQRKKLAVRHACHMAIHHGMPKRHTNTLPTTGEPDDAKVSRPVRRGASGKGLTQVPRR